MTELGLEGRGADVEPMLWLSACGMILAARAALGPNIASGKQISQHGSPIGKNGSHDVPGAPVGYTPSPVLLRSSPDPGVEKELASVERRCQKHELILEGHRATQIRVT
jgi:hypothetical protein